MRKNDAHDIKKSIDINVCFVSYTEVSLHCWALIFRAPDKYLIP